jgi:uncharacterized protein YkwD
MRRLDSHSRTVGALVVTALVVAVGASAAWSDGEPSDTSAAVSAATVTVSAEAPATPDASPTASLAPTRPATEAGAVSAVLAASSVPAGGLACRGAGGPGAAEQKIWAIGRAINVWRVNHGRKALSTRRSPTLIAHAKLMATTGGIWHSGRDNIVGCVSNDSARYMVKAWAASPPHRRQMLRRDVHVMAVGGAVNDGWLFGAVRFR